MISIIKNRTQTRICMPLVFILCFALFVGVKNVLQFQPFTANGRIDHDGEPVSRASLQLYKDNALVNSLLSKLDGSFSFSLEINSNYFIKVTKDGYIEQGIEVSTDLKDTDPASIKQTSFSLCFFMIENFEGLNTSIFTQPVAKYMYDAREDKIVENSSYRNSMKPKIENVKDELEKLKAQAYQSDIESSKDLAREGNLKEAFNNYRESYYKYYKDDKVKIAKEKNDTLKDTGNKKGKDHASKENDQDGEFASGKGPAPQNDTMQASIVEMEASLKEIEAGGNTQELSSLLSQLASAYADNENYAKAINYYERGLQIEEAKGNHEEVANIQSEIAVAYFDSGRYNKTIEFFNRSLEIKESLGDKAGIAATLSDMATVYENTFQYDNAIEYYTKAIEITNELDNKNTSSYLLSDLGLIYYEQSDYENTLESFEKSLQYSVEAGNEEVLKNALHNLGVVYYDMGNYEKALEYYQRAYEQVKQLSDKEGMASVLNNMGNIHYDWEKYKQALDYYEQALQLRSEVGSIRGEAASLHNIGNVYVKLNKIDKAIEYFMKSNELANRANYTELISKNYKALYKAYYSAKDCRQAIQYSELYNHSRIDLFDDDQHEQITDMQYARRDNDIHISKLKRELEKQKLLTKYESDRRRKELAIKNLEIKRNEAIAKKRKTIAYASLGGLIGVLIFSFFLFREYSAKKKANLNLIDKNKQILAQKKNITDSITYASRIQNALLPHSAILNDILSEYFILFKPRDIVSGDFYWITQKEEKILVAAADCTGHGVPGAFMSMLGFAFLNEIVNESTRLTAGKILDELRKRVIKSLHQTGTSFEESKDGMDMVLCVIDPKRNEVQYAGAYNPIYMLRNKELTIFKGDKMPIAIHANAEVPFTTQHIKTEKGDTFYLFSDGYADQFGGPDFKKFMTKKFQNLLMGIYEYPMHKQKEMLDCHFEEWKGNMEQMDDIMVIGLRI